MPGLLDLGFKSYEAAPGDRVTKRLLTHAAYSAVTNPTTATSLLGGAVTGLWPTFARAGDFVRVIGGGHQTLTTTSTVTWTILNGSTTVATLGPNTGAGSTHGFYFDLWFKFDSATSVRPYGIANLRTPASTGFQAVSAISDLFMGDGTPVTVSAAPQDFDIKAIIGTGNASSTVTLESLDVWRYPA